MASYSAPAAACAARVLLALAEARGPMSLTELARETECSKSLTFRVMRELELVDLVQNPSNGGYRLGSAVLEFSHAMPQLSGGEQMAEILRDLSQRTRQTVNFGVLSGADVLITAKQQPPQQLVSVTYVGARLAANCSAIGKLLLAQLTPEELEKLLPDPLPALTSRSTVDRDQLAAELQVIRDTGWAIDREGAILGRFALAVPVKDPGTGELGGLAVTGSMDDFTDAHLAELHSQVLRSARRIARLSDDD